MKIGIDVVCNAVVVCPSKWSEEDSGYPWSLNIALSESPQSHPAVPRTGAGSLMGNAMVSKEFLLAQAGVLLSVPTFMSTLLVG